MLSAIDSLSFLRSMDTLTIVSLFWYAFLLEVPRYLIGTFVVATAAIFRPRPRPWRDTGMTVSVLLAGHNEADIMRRSLTALAEQTIARTPGRMQVVVVDDGSTDGMSEIAGKLQQEGLIDQTLRVQTRGGKSAAVNLGLTVCTGEIVVISDIDTSLNRNAIERLLHPFDDPQVGAVGGDLGVRNWTASMTTRHQAIEYMIAISLGRRIGNLLGTLSIISGAFGAFRRTAVEGVGCQDVEVGEDADLTMKLRRAGWKIRFAPAARALTDVPETMPTLIAQRLRWDKGVVTIWLRKFRGVFNPFQSTFRLRDVFALLDVLVFQFLLTLLFPAYILWLSYYLGPFTPVVLGAVMIGYIVLDLLTFLVGAILSEDPLERLRLLPYLPFYTFQQITTMRFVRLIAIVQELVWRSSYKDPYVPARVMRQVDQV